MAYGSVNVPGKLTAADVGASPVEHKHTKSEITDFPSSMPASDVPAWAKAASKPSYTASEVGARPDTWTPTAAQVGAVPTTRTVNGKALNSDISLTAADVGARPSTWMPTAADVGALPSGGTAAAATKLATTRTIQTNLSSSSTASFNGTANVTPGVTGVLSKANGGTGNSRGYIQVGRKDGTEIGTSATAEGFETTSSAACSHAEGQETIASGSFSHAEGRNATASGDASHAEGHGSNASADYSHAEGSGTTASGGCAHTEGAGTTASGSYSHAGGYNTIASARFQTAIGSFNVESTSETNKFIIGEGWINRANCFRVTGTGVFATGSYASTGADYAELFEWADGNPDAEDRAGLFVTLDGEKIRPAGPEDDFILGIISGNPSVIGDVHDDQWQGMYLYDIFGRPLWEDVEVPDETIEEPDPENPENTITRVIIPARTEHRQKINPDYDNSQKYVPRTQRPEWGCVGMMGKLTVIDDGTCQVNGWCAPGEGGAATASAERTKYRVMARLDKSHIRVLVL